LQLCFFTVREDLMETLHEILLIIQRSVSFVGVMVIFIGVLVALGQFAYYLLTNQAVKNNHYLNAIRMRLGKTLILGLEFIVAADLIGTTTTPDYYALGMLAIIVVIRTILSFTLNRELQNLVKEQ